MSLLHQRRAHTHPDSIKPSIPRNHKLLQISSAASPSYCHGSPGSCYPELQSRRLLRVLLLLSQIRRLRMPDQDLKKTLLVLPSSQAVLPNSTPVPRAGHRFESAGKTLEPAVQSIG